MRIIYITASLPYGSGEAFIVEEVRELIRLGHEVRVVPRSPRGAAFHAEWMTPHTERERLFSARVLGEGCRACSDSPRTVRNAMRGIWNWRSGRQNLKNVAVVPKALWLAALAREWDADHIHCHWGGTTATMALLASRMSGVPWSLTLHRWDIVENNALAVKVDSAAFTRVISEGGRRLVSARGGDASKVHVVHVGVRIPERAEWDPPALPVVLCPANLVAVKGHRYLLEAWRILQDRGTAGELWLAGTGVLAAELEGLTTRLGIASSVKFLGARRHETLLGFYENNLISAVALASIDMGSGCHEGIPVALVEAMGYGIPVVSTMTGSIPELVTPEAGILVPPEDPQALADGIERVLNDQAFARKLGVSGRKHVLESFDVRAVSAELEQLFLTSGSGLKTEAGVSMAARSL